MTHVRLGADPFPPYQYFTAEGQIAGIDYATVTGVFRRAETDVEVLLRDWSEVERMLAAGEIDGAFQVQKTPEREARWHFSHLLRHAVTEIITADSTLAVNNLMELAPRGLRLGIIAGYAVGEAVDSLPDGVRVPYPTQEALLHAVATGEVPLAVFDRGVREYLMRTESLNPIFPLKNLDFLRPLYVVFRDAALRDLYNAHTEAF